jgi:UDP-N-acetylglucosamine--N-acetylmuramyl-(pentapeptide) pyrophosphoryl-undecaprenol N-acetylglucosamine transferase
LYWHRHGVDDQQKGKIMIAITGGGTGGHLVIAKAIKEALNQRGIKPIYIGSSGGQDRAWFEGDTGFSYTYFLQSQGVVNKKGFQKLHSLFAIAKAAFTCKALFKEHHITTVFSVGGYSAAPASFAALLTCKPLFIHEQNAIKGKLNTLLKPFASAFFSSYDRHATFTNYPVANAFFETRRERSELKTLIFLGGSQGASFINTLAKEMAKALHEKGIRIIHQTGAKEYASLKAFYETEGIPADVFDFSHSMPEKLAQADCAISRSGASTLWELCANGLPAFFIPFPYAAANHQYFNAHTLAQKGLCFMEEQSTLVPEKLLARITQLDVNTISRELTNTIQKGGAQEIVAYLLNSTLEEKSC